MPTSSEIECINKRKRKPNKRYQNTSSGEEGFTSSILPRPKKICKPNDLTRSSEIASISASLSKILTRSVETEDLSRSNIIVSGLFKSIGACQQRNAVIDYMTQCYIIDL